VTGSGGVGGEGKWRGGERGAVNCFLSMGRMHAAIKQVSRPLVDHESASDMPCTSLKYYGGVYCYIHRLLRYGSNVQDAPPRRALHARQPTARYVAYLWSSGDRAPWNTCHGRALALWTLGQYKQIPQTWSTIRERCKHDLVPCEDLSQYNMPTLCYTIHVALAGLRQVLINVTVCMVLVYQPSAISFRSTTVQPCKSRCPTNRVRGPWLRCSWYILLPLVARHRPLDLQRGHADRSLVLASALPVIEEARLPSSWGRRRG
jgi:hypothetical protein